MAPGAHQNTGEHFRGLGKGFLGGAWGGCSGGGVSMGFRYRTASPKNNPHGMQFVYLKRTLDRCPHVHGSVQPSPRPAPPGARPRWAAPRPRLVVWGAARLHCRPQRCEVPIFRTLGRACCHLTFESSRGRWVVASSPSSPGFAGHGPGDEGCATSFHVLTGPPSTLLGEKHVQVVSSFLN